MDLFEISRDAFTAPLNFLFSRKNFPLFLKLFLLGLTSRYIPCMDLSIFHVTQN